MPTPRARAGARRRRLDALLDGDAGGFRHRDAVVTRPLEGEGAALDGDGGERDERVRGDGRMQIGAEDLGAVVGGDEAPDDVARDRDPELGAAIAGLHHVRDQGLDLDDLAALGPGRHVDQRTGHQASSRQAASVTTTAARADQNEPSLSSAIATTVWVSARRMRVATVARPARGPR